jgi:UPF0755 protein
MNSDQTPVDPLNNVPKVSRRMVALLTLAGLMLISQALFIMPPRDFPEGELIQVKQGWTVSEVAEYLGEHGVIRSPFIFKVIAIITGLDNKLVAGYYVLDDRPTMLEVFTRLARGEYHLVPVKVTIPEGATTEEVGLILDKSVPGFDLDAFKVAAADWEGYLFPDTYFFMPGTTVEEIIQTMNDNFVMKLRPLEKRLSDSGHSLEEIVTMASLLEEEARTTQSRKVISGILWKRVSTGMRLQVDAVFPYIIGKNTYELTKEDLRFDSPYNTYRYKGLPPGPISNPGLDSIMAALSPESSPYWFYLSDLDGNMHYARNYDQHKVNAVRYIP